MQLPEGQGISPELLELYSPILNVCKHYRWAVGMQIAQDVAVSDPQQALDFIVGNSGDATSVAVGNDFWKGGSVPPLDAGFYFSQLGPELNPEQVLDRLALLRS